MDGADGWMGEWMFCMRPRYLGPLSRTLAIDQLQGLFKKAPMYAIHGDDGTVAGFKGLCRCTITVTLS